ncbi:hypothetical protein JHW43_005096 [Diplocarpon mali]|nr:hypothetical protein JHW43_005096 [Diplocarpon mali]
MTKTLILIRHAEAQHNATNKSPHTAMKDSVPIVQAAVPDEKMQAKHSSGPFMGIALLLDPPCNVPQELWSFGTPGPLDRCPGHILTIKVDTIPDPALTDLGFRQQCSELAQHLQNELPLAQEIELIVVSPMRRTMQTAEQALGWLIGQGVPVMLRAEFQENSSKPCDTGTSIAIMQKEWPQFDWSSVDPIYPENTGLYEFSMNGLRQRGIAARRFLKNRPERVIAVVSHAGFLRTSLCHRRFNNADFRIFDFKEDENNLELVERELTEKRGGGLGKSETGVFLLKDGDAPEVAVGLRDEVVDEVPT